jgi:hypothetical protein
LDAKIQNIIKAQDVDIIFKTATMTITNHQDEQRQRQAALRQQVTSGFRVDSEVNGIPYYPVSAYHSSTV